MTGGHESRASASGAGIRPHVSSRAIVHYVQRILGVSLDHDPGEVSTSKLAWLYAIAAGRSHPGAIAREILTPAVRNAIHAGFHEFGNRHFVAVVSACGTIKVIQSPYPRNTGRLHIMTDREARRQLRFIERCQRSRPETAQ